MEKIPKTTNLVAAIKLVLEKSRGSLADDDIYVLENACEVLNKLDDVEPTEARRVLTELSTGLLKVLLRPEVLEQVGKWLNHFLDK